ncbi:MAG: enediyne biosynthesis protein, partial [Pseudonocardiales bacterium]|nr:enediyne biosynthesis protein [Pseudonocardiales bacterium]
MFHTLLNLRSSVLTPNRRETTFAFRGFQPRDERARTVLESAGNGFLDGFAMAAGTPSAAAAAARLQYLPAATRGFGYEGAAMALAMLEVGRPRSGELRRFLTELAGSHVYLAYVGVGWALARLPRPLWRRPVAALADPVLDWLVLDGYGFHEAYFDTGRTVGAHRRPAGLSWQGHTGDGPVQSVFDQGVGRALWFVCGADPRQLASTLDGFDRRRRPDLVAGLGLAATYAGGADAEVLATVREIAGEHAAQLAQGAVFAAETRARSGAVNPHTEAACQALAGISVAEAVDLATTTRPTEATTDGEVSYQVWR